MNGGAAQRTSHGVIAALAAATIGWRFVLSLRTPVPSGDGCSYLWIASQFADGNWALGLSEVFPPGLPLLCAPWLAIGCDAWTVGLCICLFAAGLTVWPLVRIADHVRPGAGVPAAILWLSSSLLARNAAEVYSEPTFLLAMAVGSLHGLRAQWWRCGVWSGIAFLIRPEGALLAASFALVHRGAVIRTLVPLAAAVLGLGLLRLVNGHGFDPLPMLLFHVNERDDLPERGNVLANLLQVPVAWAEAFGPVGLLPLLLLVRSWRPDRCALPFVWQIVMQIGAVCTFVTRKRFMLSAAVPVIALAGVALAPLRVRWRALLLSAMVLWGAVGAWRGVTDADRFAERRVGERLATLLRPEDDFVTDLTRVRWFAGRRPLWPRHFTVDELLAAAAKSNVRYVVLSEDSVRGQFAALSRGLAAGYERQPLPPEIEVLCRSHRIAIFVRR